MAHLKPATFISIPTADAEPGGVPRAVMTANGTVVRTAMLLGLSVIAAVVGWLLVGTQPVGSSAVQTVAVVGVLVSAFAALGFGIWAARRPLRAKVPAMLYATFQGFVIGFISAGFSAQYDGIITQALMITGAAVAVTLVMFATGVIKVTRKFVMVIMVATASIFVFYLVALVLSLFGVSAPLIWDSGPWGIGFTVIVLLVAISNLFVDYQIVQDAISQGADERFEWYAAFGITATVLWVYIEALRLLSKIRN